MSRRNGHGGAEQRQLLGRVAIERRAEGDGQVETIKGRAAVYYDQSDPEGTQYMLWRDCYERILPGAFDRALREDDVAACFNHNPDFVLGRTSAGTLQLSLDAKGLLYEITPPATQSVRDMVLEPIRRRDVTGSSFTMRPTIVAWVDEKVGDRTIEIREIREVELYELGPVTFPAYSGTEAEAGMRAAGDLAEVRAEWDQARGERDRRRAAAEAVEITARAVQVRNLTGRR